MFILQNLGRNLEKMSGNPEQDILTSRVATKLGIKKNNQNIHLQTSIILI